MRVCMILEGSYPYVFGGVSSWTHQYINAMPDVEFVLWCVGAFEKDRSNFKFELPKNVVEVHELFLDQALRHQDKETRKKVKLRPDEIKQIKKFLQCKNFDWDILFDLFQNGRVNPTQFLTSPIFLELIMELCEEKYPYISFCDFFHNMRSMLLPELYLITQEVPKADIYHATATGYSGILGSLAKWKYNKPFILTEHGIYTREREEELLRAKWVSSFFKQQWIDLFYTFSDCAYVHATYVTSLFERALEIQAELGCLKSKLRVIENGVHYDRFCNVPIKKEDGFVDIAAIVRIAKIKDIKTMIYAFAELKARFPKARLHILGAVDDDEYFEECQFLVEQLKIEDLEFVGMVNIIEYLEQIDFTILTSISEGQPLSVIESLAAGRPCVTTDVGCCRELLEGNSGDLLGDAGLCVPPMHKEELAYAMLRLCESRKMRLEMGEIGRKRVERYYTHPMSMSRYRELYEEVNKRWQA